MSERATMPAAFLATLVRPSWWLVAAAGFLVRGGLVLFILPIVALPSVLSVSNVVAPVIVPVVFGRTAEVVAATALATLGVGAWLVAAGWLAALTEIWLVRRAAVAAVEEGVVAPIGLDRGARGILLAGRVLAARLLAHLPLVTALALGAVRIVDVVYIELVRPFEVVTPLPIRVVTAAAVPLALIAAAWAVGELLGARAVRRIVLDDAPVTAGIGGAVRDLATRPLRTLVSDVLPLVTLALALGAMLVAAAVSWSRLRVVLLDRPVEAPFLAFALGSFVLVWLVALIVTGLLAAWRSAAPTFDHLSRRVPLSVPGEARPLADGTFGASTTRRPGDWSVDDEGGSL